MRSPDVQLWHCRLLAIAIASARLNASSSLYVVAQRLQARVVHVAAVLVAAAGCCIVAARGRGSEDIQLARLHPSPIELSCPLGQRYGAHSYGPFDPTPAIRALLSCVTPSELNLRRLLSIPCSFGGATSGKPLSPKDHRATLMRSALPNRHRIAALSRSSSSIRSLERFYSTRS